MCGLISLLFHQNDEKSFKVRIRKYLEQATNWGKRGIEVSWTASLHSDCKVFCKTICCYTVQAISIPGFPQFVVELTKGWFYNGVLAPVIAISPDIAPSIAILRFFGRSPNFMAIQFLKSINMTSGNTKSQASINRN